MTLILIFLLGCKFIPIKDKYYSKLDRYTYLEGVLDYPIKNLSIFNEDEFIKSINKYSLAKLLKNKDILEKLLFTVIEKNCNKIAKIILENGLDIETKDDSGMSILNISASCDSEMLSFLIDSGADIESIDAKGNTPLLNSLKNENIVKYLLGKGANVKAKNNKCDSCLTYYVENDNISGLELCISYGADTGSLDKYGRTPFILASYFNKIKSLNFLIKYSNIDAKDNYGQTALFYSVQNQNLESIKILIDAKANPSIVDKKGRTALMYSLSNINILGILIKITDLDIEDFNKETILYKLADISSRNSYNKNILELIEYVTSNTTKDKFKEIMLSLKKGNCSVFQAIINNISSKEFIKLFLEISDNLEEQYPSKTFLNSKNKMLKDSFINIILILLNKLKQHYIELADSSSRSINDLEDLKSIIYSYSKFKNYNEDIKNSYFELIKHLIDFNSKLIYENNSSKADEIKLLDMLSSNKLPNEILFNIFEYF